MVLSYLVATGAFAKGALTGVALAIMARKCLEKRMEANR